MIVFCIHQLHESLLDKSRSFLAISKKNRWSQGCVQKNVGHEVTKGIYSNVRAKKAAKYEYDVRDLDRVRSSRAVLDDNVLRKCV